MRPEELPALRTLPLTNNENGDDGNRTTEPTPTGHVENDIQRGDSACQTMREISLDTLAKVAERRSPDGDECTSMLASSSRMKGVGDHLR